MTISSVEEVEMRNDRERLLVGFEQRLVAGREIIKVIRSFLHRSIRLRLFV